MRLLPLHALPVVGALSTVATADGVQFRRTPSWAHPQILDPLHALADAMPTGVRLVFTSTSRHLELDLALTSFVSVVREPPAPAIDLVVAGHTITHELPFGTRVVVALDRSQRVDKGQPVTVRLDLPGDDAVPIEVWLPHGAVTELRAVRVDDGCSLRPLPRAGWRWIHYGSSISQCGGAPSPTRTWPALVARREHLDHLNLAQAGNAMMDPHVARTIRDLPADLISLELGINTVAADTMRERTFGPVLHGFLDIIRDGHPATPILLMTPIFCSALEDHPGPIVTDPVGRIRALPRPAELAAGSLTLQRSREIMGDVARTRSDRNLHLVDGRSLLGPGEEHHLPDGLHPDADGYCLIAERFARHFPTPSNPDESPSLVAGPVP